MRHAGEPAKERHNKAFGQPMCRDVHGGGPESAAYGDFLAPNYRSSQQQGGDIRGRDQKNKNRSPQQRQKRIPVVFRNVIAEWFCVNLATLRRAGPFRLQLARDTLKNRTGLLEGNARFEQRTDMQAALVAINSIILGRAEGQKDVGAAEARQEEASGHDADHGVWLILHRDDAAKHRRAAGEALHPLAIAQKSNWRRGWLEVFRLETSAQYGPRAQQRQQII